MQPPLSFSSSNRGDGNARSRGRGGCIERVDDEIQHDLLKLNGITSDRRLSRIERQTDVRLTSDNIVLENARRNSTDFVEVDWLRWQFLSSDQRANPRDDVGGEYVVGNDVAEARLE